MKRITQEQFKKLYGTQGLAVFKQEEKKPGITETIKNATVENAKQGLSKMGRGFGQVNNEGFNPLNLIEGGLKIGAGAVETVFSPLTGALEPVMKPTVGKAVEFAADKISDNKSIQKFADSKFGQATSRITEDVSDLNTIASIVGTKGTPKIGGKIISGAERAAVKTGEVVKSIAKPIQDVSGSLTRIPNRIATNLAEKRAVQSSISTLPTKIARQAAQDGLEVSDIKYISSIPKTQAPALKKLASVVKDFAEGKTKTNPIEVVGKPIVSRIKEMEKVRGAIGQKLGKVADNLGEVTTKELFPQVFNQIKKINGLSGIRVNKKGILDFTDTVLTTAETASDRAAIQSIFMDAVRKGTGKSKHLLRQELFEILGGKKKSLANLTDTQEKVFNAVRQGLSDVLETKNKSYKSLSNQYRKVYQPLQDIRRFMKGTAGASEDILDMQAGLLARRLTSFAASNPQLRNILKSMDEATKTVGKTRLKIESLQDFYNILEKYYDISPKTGFQAQVRQGVEKASGIADYAFQQIRSLAGETPAVRQKALERLLSEVFR